MKISMILPTVLAMSLMIFVSFDHHLELGVFSGVYSEIIIK